jgi:hypothetical protein
VNRPRRSNLAPRLLSWLCLFLFSASSAGSQASTPLKEIKIAAGKSADLWLGVNVTGTISYAIRTRDGSNKIKVWWIVQPLGRVTQLGSLHDTGTLKIPDLLKGSVSAKLRASATADTVVYIGENVKIDNVVTFHW